MCDFFTILATKQRSKEVAEEQHQLQIEIDQRKREIEAEEAHIEAKKELFARDLDDQVRQKVVRFEDNSRGRTKRLVANEMAQKLAMDGNAEVSAVMVRYVFKKYFSTIF